MRPAQPGFDTAATLFVPKQKRGRRAPSGAPRPDGCRHVSERTVSVEVGIHHHTHEAGGAGDVRLVKIVCHHARHGMDDPVDQVLGQGVVVAFVHSVPGMMADDFDEASIARAASFMSVVMDPEWDADCPF